MNRTLRGSIATTIVVLATVAAIVTLSNKYNISIQFGEKPVAAESQAVEVPATTQVLQPVVPRAVNALPESEAILGDPASVVNDLDSGSNLPDGVIAPAPRVAVSEVVLTDIIWKPGNVPKEVCVVTFQGVTDLCLDTYVMTDTDNGYIEGVPFNASVRLIIKSRLNGCDSFEDCFLLINDREVCTELLASIDAVGKKLGADSAFNGGVPYVPADKVVPSYWNSAGENQRITFSDDCNVTVTQL